MKAQVIIERGMDGTFSAYIGGNNRLPFGVIGEGKTVQETMEDFMGGYEEMKELFLEEGRDFPEVVFEFKYDLPSFLQYYAYAFTLAGLERITGVNQRQLSHYINGVRKPSPATVHKIEQKIHDFAAEIGAVSFV
ncbi:helix-turn-helix domain-containing protein [uncultured Rikenella sp.]|uniref:type II toxin-antitoxin system HicB family antitoxin n=1 Tax=uncultured Rikenella sp. TaxID=368003 RepID=UPI002623D82C|nr:helix-turn-helix domain-containing protein [uncultured Rikenella sp.]